MIQIKTGLLFSEAQRAKSVALFQKSQNTVIRPKMGYFKHLLKPFNTLGSEQAKHDACKLLKDK